MSYCNVKKEGDYFTVTRDHECLILSSGEARQLIADIVAALDEPLKADMTHDVKNERPNIPTQAYQEFVNRPSQNAVDELWAEKEIPFTTEQKMQAVIRKAEEKAIEEPEDLERFVNLYNIAKERGLIE